MRHSMEGRESQVMGGWESEGMVRRYAHLARVQFAHHVEVVAELLKSTTLVQPNNNESKSTD